MTLRVVTPLFLAFWQTSIMCSTIPSALSYLPLPGNVSHALHRVWEVPAPVPHWHVAHHALHDLRGHLLRHVPRPRHQPHPESWQQQETVPGKGKRYIINLQDSHLRLFKWFDSKKIFFWTFLLLLRYRDALRKVSFFVKSFCEVFPSLYWIRVNQWSNCKILIEEETLWKLINTFYKKKL